MDTRENRMPLIPYLLIVLLVGFSILLDANLRNRVATSVSLSLSAFVLQVDARWIFGLLGALFIWMVARLGLSTASAWVFVILGLLISAFPMVGLVGWLNLSDRFAFLQGDYLLSSAAMILAAGVLGLLSKVGRKKTIAEKPAGS